MKRYFIIALLLTVFVSSCKQEDDVDPNITKDFVGTWVGELIVEKGYSNRSDWKITRVSNTAIKASTVFNFISTSADYQSYTEESVVENITVMDDKTFKTTFSIPTGEGVINAESVGVISGNLLTVTSTGKNQSTGVAITPTTQKFTKQ